MANVIRCLRIPLKNAGSCTVLLNILVSWVKPTSWECALQPVAQGRTVQNCKMQGYIPQLHLHHWVKPLKGFTLFSLNTFLRPSCPLSHACWCFEQISLAGEALVNQRLAFHSGLALSGARQFAQLRAEQLITTALLGRP